MHNRVFYKKVEEKENLLINIEEAVKENSDSKRCDQSMLDDNKESVNSQSINDIKMECKRLFAPGQPGELCDSAKWPNFKIQAIRDIATGVKCESPKYPDLYNCIWLPASAPDYMPDEKSPYYSFYTQDIKNPQNSSKTIVFSKYKMTTRSIAALISAEAAKDGKSIGFTDEQWEELKKIPCENTDFNSLGDLYMLGHPFCCAYNALQSKIQDDVVRKYYAQIISDELIEYFKRPEIQAVLARTGVNSIDGLLQYCKDGNLTAVLREYLSMKKLPYVNKAIIYAASQISDWGELCAAEKLEKIYNLAWDEMTKADPQNILDDIRNNGFKSDYITQNKEPYDGLINGKSDGFEEVRIAAWKTWFAYQIMYRDNKDKIRAKIRAKIDEAIDKDRASQKTTKYKLYYTFSNPYKVPQRYISNFEINSKLKCEVENVEEFFNKAKSYRSKEKCENNCKTSLKMYTEYSFNNDTSYRALNTPLFDKMTHDLWDELDYNYKDYAVLDFMPEMHVCADFKTPQGVQCGRILLGFAARYTDEIQDSNDHNDDGAAQVMDAFNSPFYPFVLAVTDTAKEGLNFHTYCRRIVHLNIPDRPAVLIQREGRVDRYRSLVLRQRMAIIIKDWNAVFEKFSSDNANGMTPNWYIDLDDGPKIEKYYLINEGTEDILKEADIESDAELYKRMLGSFLEEELLKKLNQRYPNDNLTKLKLNLIP